MNETTTTFAEQLQAFAGDLSRLRKAMRAQLHSDVPLIDTMKGEHYFTGGKQLRAMMALSAARLHGLPAATAEQIAIGIEFIHAATLLHDDVVDNATLRRHQPTACATYGNEAAVLAGDFLYSRASQLFARIGSVRLLQRVSDATNQLAQGELIQLLQRGKSTLSEAEYWTIIEKKTANLFEVATASAAILSDNDEAPLATFGHQIGLAFQLIDDYLDYGSSDSGKTIGADFKERKMTLPMIILLNRVDNSTRQNLLTHWQANENSSDSSDAAQLQTIINLMQQNDVFNEVQKQAQHCVQKATTALQTYPNSSTRTQMLALAATSIHRTY